MGVCKYASPSVVQSGNLVDEVGRPFIILKDRSLENVVPISTDIDPHNIDGKSDPGRRTFGRFPQGLL